LPNEGGETGFTLTSVRRLQLRNAQEKFESSRTVIISAFERLFPAKSKFEKQVPPGPPKKAPALAPGLFCRKGQKECP